MKKFLVDKHTGSLLAGGTNNPTDTTGKGGIGNTGYDWANEYNMIQQYAIKNSRLHIPLIFGVDAVHGFGHPWQAPLFPQSIGMGATWDPSAAASRRRGDRERAARDRLGLGLRPGAGPLAGQPMGSHVRDLGRGAGAVRGHGRRQRRGPSVCRVRPARSVSPRPSSTSPDTRSRSTATTATRRCCR